FQFSGWRQTANRETDELGMNFANLRAHRGYRRNANEANSFHSALAQINFEFASPHVPRRCIPHCWSLHRNTFANCPLACQRNLRSVLGKVRAGANQAQRKTRWRFRGRCWNGNFLPPESAVQEHQDALLIAAELK